MAYRRYSVSDDWVVFFKKNKKKQILKALLKINLVRKVEIRIARQKLHLGQIIVKKDHSPKKYRN